MNDRPSIADQIRALEVHVPQASRYQNDRIKETVERKLRRGPRHNTLTQRRAAEVASNNLERIFNLIVKAALADERCPTSDECSDRHGISNSTRIFADLAAAGRIRIEVTARNYRTVWICAGEHRGLHTRLPVFASRPHMVRGPARP